MKVSEGLKIAAILGVGFVAVRAAMKVRDAVAAGGEFASSAADVVKKIATEDLNPASDKNVVYTAVNGLGTLVTKDQNFTLGGWLHDKIHGPIDLSTPSNVARQREQFQIENDDFRRTEITAQNLEAKTEQAAEEQMSRNRSNFRLSEISQQNGYTPTSWDAFLQTIAGQR